jgi:DNA-binding MarR family transcriptional regulator
MICGLHKHRFRSVTRKRLGSYEVDKDLRDVAGCTCLSLRRATRRLTQIYDHILEPSGLTVTQFGLLATISASIARPDHSSIGAIADALGTDPTTLNRNLKPLKARGLVKDFSDPSDGRVRTIRITEKGQRELSKAIPLWRRAHKSTEEVLGQKSRLALNELLDRLIAKTAS